MPDNNNNSELMNQLREQLELIKKPGGVPVHRNVDAALNLIANILGEVDDTNNNQDQDLAEIRSALDQLRTDLQANTDADAADHIVLNELSAKVERLILRVDQIPAEVDQKITTALAPVNTEIEGIKQRETGDRKRITDAEKEIDDLHKKDTADDDRHQKILDAIAELEKKIKAGGITEAEAQALIDTNLTPIRAAIEALEAQDTADDARIIGILADISRLETEIKAKITGAEAQTLIDAGIAPLGRDIAALKQKDAGHDESIVALGLKDVAHEGSIAGLTQKDLIHDQGIAGLDTRVTALENIPPGGGLPESEVRRIIGEELVPVKADLAFLKQKDISDDIRYTGLVARVDALERQPPGGGLSEAEVRRIVGDEIQRIRTELTTLINYKADKTELYTKANQSALDGLTNIVNGKAEQSALTALTNTVNGKAEQSALNDLTNTVNGKAEQSALNDLTNTVNGKADQSALNDLTNTVNGKADQSALNDLTNTVNGKAEQSALNDLTNTVNGKAEQSALNDLTNTVNGKADQSDLNDLTNTVNGKADQSDLNDLTNTVNGKADQSDLNDLTNTVNGKADQSDLNDLTNTVNGKADQSDLTALTNTVNGKADQSDLTALTNTVNGKAEQSDLDNLETIVAGKANQTEIVRIDQEIKDLREDWLQEDQNSPGVCLARLCLTGWGIVGGLEIHSDEKDYITITPGTGVTPAGELVVEPGLEKEEDAQVKLAKTPSHKSKKDHKSYTDEHTKQSLCDPPKPDNLVFSHYQLYAKAAEYGFFKKPDSNEVYTIWELLQPSDNLPPDARPLTPQTDAEYATPFISDKIILLLFIGDKRYYLLMRRTDLLEKLCCLPHQCKSKEDDNADYLFEEDYSPEDDYISDDEVLACLHPAMRLPEIPLFRFGFFTEEECEPDELDNTDFPDLKNINDFYSTWRPIIEDAIGRLEKGIRMLIRRYHPTLFPLLHKKMFREKLDDLSEKWTRFTVSNDPPKTLADETGTKYYAQYFYDWMRDLIGAYHELRWEIIGLMNDLRPYTLETLAKQHKHLLLGPAEQPDNNYGLDAPLRDAFRQPPIYNGNAARLETCRLYYRRLFQMIDGFYLEKYAPNGNMPGWCCHEDDNGAVVEQKPDFDRLRITPGKSYIYPLSEQSIPFYYPLIDHPQSLQHYWNYRRAKTRSADRLLSYHATDAPPEFPSYTGRREAIRPLYYSLDPHDFYRIEGHIGKSTVRLYPKAGETDERIYDVYEALQYLVRKHNLDFKVIKLSITDLQNPEGGSSAPYTLDNGTTSEKAQSFRLDLLGAEHLAGVPKGGTFILVYEEEDVTGAKKKTKHKAGEEEDKGPRVIADFSLPYKCCSATSDFNAQQLDSKADKAVVAALQVKVEAVITDIDSKVAGLDAKVETKITEAELRQIVDARADKLKTDIENDFGREVDELKDKTEAIRTALENKPGREEIAASITTGITEVTDKLNEVAGRTDRLQNNLDLGLNDIVDIKQKLDLKADKTDLALKADQNEVVILFNEVETQTAGLEAKVAILNNRTEVTEQQLKVVKEKVDRNLP